MMLGKLTPICNGQVYDAVEVSDASLPTYDDDIEESDVSQRLLELTHTVPCSSQFV